MKKFIALMIAVMLLVPAFAVADGIGLNGATNFKMSVSDFIQQFTTLASSMNYDFEIESEPNSELGYNIYIGHSSDGLCYVFIHEGVDGTMFFQSILKLDLTNQADKAQKAGEDLGAAMVCAGFALYQGEFGELSMDVINKVTGETTDLMTPLYSLGGLTEQQLEDGIAHVGTMCGFPAGTEVQCFTEDGITYLSVIFYLCPTDWELTVE